jgi:DNA (cytosine-5)-methyltransferase 1
VKILNLFAGIGGNRSLWGNNHEIVAIESNPDIAAIYKKRFPNDIVIVTDAYEYLRLHYKEFDFIWCSPPCPSHSKMNRVMESKNYDRQLPDMNLYSIIIHLYSWYKRKWIVENVVPYYKKLVFKKFIPLIRPDLTLDRHWIWTNIKINPKKFENLHPGVVITYLKNPELCKLHNIDENLIKNFKNTLGVSHDGKRKILRNCVDSRIGKYILDCVKKETQKSILDY